MASSSTHFGNFFTSIEFDAAVTEFVGKWIDTHLSEVELALGYDRRTVDRPKSYNVAVNINNWPLEVMPGILVVSGGFVDPPTRDGGQYNGWWEWVLAAVLEARDYDSVKLKVGIYQAALRLMFMQHPDLDGAVADTVWLSEPTDYAPVEGRNRTRGVAAFQFRSYIEGVVDASVGVQSPDPADPLPDPSTPHDDLPVVDTVGITMSRTKLT